MSHSCTTACTAGWPAGSKCHCTLCGRDFGSVTLFDKHQKRGKCEDPTSWRDVFLDQKGVWRKWVERVDA